MKNLNALMIAEGLTPRILHKPAKIQSHNDKLVTELRNQLGASSISEALPALIPAALAALTGGTAATAATAAAPAAATAATAAAPAATVAAGEVVTTAAPAVADVAAKAAVDTGLKDTLVNTGINTLQNINADSKNDTI
ncbi:MAG: hypothetical protein WCJ49_06025, partial [Deltaproteobacteria bacterium]